MGVRMSTAAATWTVQAWAALPEDDDRELVGGELVEAEVAGFGHCRVVALLTVQLHAHFAPRGAYVVGDGLRLSLTDRGGRVPDAAVFLARPPRTGPVDLAPAIVVEVLSPGPVNQRRDRLAKVAEYAARGIAQCWIVDPEAQTLEILALRGAVYAHVAAGARGPLPVPDHPGLTLDLDALFEVDADAP